MAPGWMKRKLWKGAALKKRDVLDWIKNHKLTTMALIDGEYNAAEEEKYMAWIKTHKGMANDLLDRAYSIEDEETKDRVMSELGVEDLYNWMKENETRASSVVGEFLSIPSIGSALILQWMMDNRPAASQICKEMSQAIEAQKMRQVKPNFLKGERRKVTNWDDVSPPKVWHPWYEPITVDGLNLVELKKHYVRDLGGIFCVDEEAARQEAMAIDEGEGDTPKPGVEDFPYSDYMMSGAVPVGEPLLPLDPPGVFSPFERTAEWDRDRDLRARQYEINQVEGRREKAAAAAAAASASASASVVDPMELELELPPPAVPSRIIKLRRPRVDPAPIDPDVLLEKVRNFKKEFEKMELEEEKAFEEEDWDEADLDMEDIAGLDEEEEQEEDADAEIKEEEQEEDVDAEIKEEVEEDLFGDTEFFLDAISTTATEFPALGITITEPVSETSEPHGLPALGITRITWPGDHD
ncbi:hypothetical protein V8F20_001176, partial [Naviculisporaceae sp. PSN 640]